MLWNTFQSSLGYSWAARPQNNTQTDRHQAAMTLFAQQRHDSLQGHVNQILNGSTRCHVTVLSANLEPDRALLSIRTSSVDYKHLNTFAFIWSVDFWSSSPPNFSLSWSREKVPLIWNSSLSIQLLWKQAQSFPMFPALGEMESHMFQCINQAAVHEELEDETRRLCDVRPFLPMLKLVTRNCGRADRLLDSKIGVLIGKGEASFIAIAHTCTCTHTQSLRKLIAFLCEKSFFPFSQKLIDVNKQYNRQTIGHQ